MKNFNISKVDFSNEELRNCIDSKTKPLGALGLLEKIGYQIGCIQKTVQLKNNIDGNHELITSGMVKHHYAPNTPMFSIADILLNNSLLLIGSRFFMSIKDRGS